MGCSETELQDGVWSAVVSWLVCCFWYDMYIAQRQCPRSQMVVHADTCYIIMYVCMYVVYEYIVHST